MSSVCVLTPVVIATWPAILAAVTSAASAMGFSIAVPAVLHSEHSSVDTRRKVEVDIDATAAAEAGIELGQSIIMTQDALEIRVSQNDRGALSVCVIDESRSKSELARIGNEVAGRIIQQFAYHKLMTELRARGFDIVDQAVTHDQSIEVRVRMNHEGSL